MRSLFEYDSYRLFLQDFFKEMKDRRKSFSYREFARRAGFSSCGFCHQVIKGQRNLSNDATQKMIRGVGFSGKKADYFSALVLFEQARTPQEKTKAYATLNYLRKDSHFFRLHRAHFRYFEHWWYPVLRNLVVYAPWGDDFALLADLVDPPISEEQARRGVQVLQELNMVTQDTQGQWHLCNALISSEDIPGLVKAQTRQDLFQLGLEALEKFHRQERYATYYTLGITQEAYGKICDLIEEMNLKASTVATDSQEVDRIYELTTMLFPVSDSISKFRKGET